MDLINGHLSTDKWILINEHVDCFLKGMSDSKGYFYQMPAVYFPELGIPSVL